MEQLNTIGRELTMGSQASAKEFLELIKEIIEAKSKDQEERIVIQEVGMLKNKISEPDVPRRRMKDYIILLFYVKCLDIKYKL